MAWIQRTRRKDGDVTYWIRDVREGQAIVIDAKATSYAEAEMKLEQYRIRRDLEKEGYDDVHQDLLDKLWGTKERTNGMARKA